MLYWRSCPCSVFLLISALASVRLLLMNFTFIAGAFHLLRRLCSGVDLSLKVQQNLLSSILKDLEGRRVRTPTTKITGTMFRQAYELLEAVIGWYKFIVTSGPLQWAETWRPRHQPTFGICTIGRWPCWTNVRSRTTAINNCLRTVADHPMKACKHMPCFAYPILQVLRSKSAVNPGL